MEASHLPEASLGCIAAAELLEELTDCLDRWPDEEQHRLVQGCAAALRRQPPPATAKTYLLAARGAALALAALETNIAAAERLQGNDPLVAKLRLLFLKQLPAQLPQLVNWASTDSAPSAPLTVGEQEGLIVAGLSSLGCMAEMGVVPLKHPTRPAAPLAVDAVVGGALKEYALAARRRSGDVPGRVGSIVDVALVRAVAGMDAKAVAVYCKKCGGGQLAQAVLLAGTAHLWRLARSLRGAPARRERGGAAGEHSPDLDAEERGQPALPPTAQSARESEKGGVISQVGMVAQVVQEVSRFRADASDAGLIDAVEACTQAVKLLAQAGAAPCSPAQVGALDALILCQHHLLYLLNGSQSFTDTWQDGSYLLDAARLAGRAGSSGDGLCSRAGAAARRGSGRSTTTTTSSSSSDISTGAGTDLYGPPRGVAAIAEAACVAASIICRVVGKLQGQTAQAGKSGDSGGSGSGGGEGSGGSATVGTAGRSGTCPEGFLLPSLIALALQLFTGLSSMGHSLVNALNSDNSSVHAACFATLPPTTALRVAEAGARLTSATDPLFDVLPRTQPVPLISDIASTLQRVVLVTPLLDQWRHMPLSACLVMLRLSGLGWTKPQLDGRAPAPWGAQQCTAALRMVGSTVAALAVGLRTGPQSLAVISPRDWHAAMCQAGVAAACLWEAGGVQGPEPVLVEREDPRQAEEGGSLTSKLRLVGFGPFVCVPALAQWYDHWLPALRQDQGQGDEQAPHQWGNLLKNLRLLVGEMGRSGLMELAVRGGLGGLLARTLPVALESAPEVAAHHLLEVGLYCLRWPALVVGLGTSGMLAELVDWALSSARRRQQQRRRRQRRPDGQEAQGAYAMAAAAYLIHGCSCCLDCCVDAKLGALLSRVVLGALPAHACVDNQTLEHLGGLPLRTLQRLGGPAFWEEVRAVLLPELLAVCERLDAGSCSGASGPTSDRASGPTSDRASGSSGASGGSAASGLYTELATAGVMCCNPACTDLLGAGGCRLGVAQLKACAGCGEARYHCKQCQRADWQRHKPICLALRELKAGEASCS